VRKKKNLNRCYIFRKRKKKKKVRHTFLTVAPRDPQFYLRPPSQFVGDQEGASISSPRHRRSPEQAEK
jgi:hypothetical protein